MYNDGENNIMVLAVPGQSYARYNSANERKSHVEDLHRRLTLYNNVI